MLCSTRRSSIGDDKDPCLTGCRTPIAWAAKSLAPSNNKKAAIARYKRYLELAPDGAIDRKEVRKILRDWEIEIDESLSARQRVQRVSASSAQVLLPNACGKSDAVLSRISGPAAVRAHFEAGCELDQHLAACAARRDRLLAFGHDDDGDESVCPCATAATPRCVRRRSSARSSRSPRCSPTNTLPSSHCSAAPTRKREYGACARSSRASRGARERGPIDFGSFHAGSSSINACSSRAKRALRRARGVLHLRMIELRLPEARRQVGDARHARGSVRPCAAPRWSRAPCSCRPRRRRACAACESRPGSRSSARARPRTRLAAAAIPSRARLLGERSRSARS